MTGPGMPMRHLPLSRRKLLQATGAGALAVSLPFRPISALAAPSGPSHGMSIFGDLKYPPDFKAFDYVNRDAPKGGTFAFRPANYFYNQNTQTFNTLNGFTNKGAAPFRVEMCFDSLMARAFDEPDAVYGLLAETVEFSEDGNTCIFNLRPEALFHDGSAVTAEDVAFSLLLLKTEGHNQIRGQIQELETVEALEEYRVALRFTGSQTKQLPFYLSGLPIFSKAYYSGRGFSDSTLEPPLGSGPYKVGRFKPGTFIEYDRVDGYWGKDLPANAGQHNFDVIRIDFFRDYQAAFEAFKKGDVAFQEEFSSKIWSTEYNFPAVRNGRVIREQFGDKRPSGAQGWLFNTRREKFKNPKVREALGYAFDFEWSNQNLFYGLYRRTHSFFENSDMKAEGLPSDGELALLEPFRECVPEAVFGEAITAPVSDGSGNDRKLFRKALGLLKEAGYTLQGAELIGSDGKQLEIEFLSNVPQFKRIVLPFVDNLIALGIKATFRLVDGAQYQARLNDFDFDIASRRYGLTPTLTDGAHQIWGSRSAMVPGTYNTAGIADPAVDDLIEIALSAGTREEMNIAVRAMDRVLRAGHYWVPQWNNPFHNIARWDMFSFPDYPPLYDFPVEKTWWFDRQKAERIGKAG